MDLTGLGSAFGFAKGIMDRFWPKQASEEEKLEVVSKMLPMIEQRDKTVIEAQKSIIVAEMQQGDNFTKRARPAVVYMGLLFIALVHVIFPIMIKLIVLFKAATLTAEQIAQVSSLLELSLPGEFWAAWGAVVSIWSIGRSVERRGAVNKIVGMITGN